MRRLRDNGWSTSSRGNDCTDKALVARRFLFFAALRSRGLSLNPFDFSGVLFCNSLCLICGRVEIRMHWVREVIEIGTGACIHGDTDDATCQQITSSDCNTFARCHRLYVHDALLLFMLERRGESCTAFFGHFTRCNTGRSKRRRDRHARWDRCEVYSIRAAARHGCTTTDSGCGSEQANGDKFRCHVIGTLY